MDDASARPALGVRAAAGRWCGLRPQRVARGSDRRRAAGDRDRAARDGAAPAAARPARHGVGRWTGVAAAMTALHSLTLGEILEEHRRARPQQLAVVGDGLRLTY